MKHRRKPFLKNNNYNKKQNGYGRNNLIFERDNDNYEEEKKSKNQNNISVLIMLRML